MQGLYDLDNPPPPPPGTPPRDASCESRSQQFRAPSSELIQTPMTPKRPGLWHLNGRERAKSRNEAEQAQPQHSHTYKSRDGRDRSRSPALGQVLKEEESFHRENVHYRERSSHGCSSDRAIQQRSSTHAQRHKYVPKPTYIDRRNEIEDEVDWGDEDLEDVKPVLSTAILELDTNITQNHRVVLRENEATNRPMRSRRVRDARVVREIDHYSPPRLPTVQDYSKPRTQTDHASQASGSLQNDVPVPSTVYNLRDYDGQIVVQNKKRPRKERFFNGNGKVKPTLYGSTQDKDLGLCFTTFCTKFLCEMGVNCPWRHHPLTKAERRWILAMGGDLGRKFMHNVDMWWNCPEMPVPGACMHEKV